MVEALASLWATSSSESDRPDPGQRSIVIPPEGTSVPALVSDLAALGVPVSLLDDPTSPPNALLVVSRSQVRGLDLPDLSTVYILGGLGVDTVSKKMRANGGVAEKEREYAHMAGRVGRLGGREEGGGKSQRVVTIVLQGSEEHKAMERFVAGDGGVPLDPWPVPLL
jgi:superfamily II DNA/RNA helicase